MSETETEVPEPENITCQFNGGPKDGESVVLGVTADLGPPSRIRIQQYDPVNKNNQMGIYTQSVFNPTLYVWSGWEGPTSLAT